MASRRRGTATPATVALTAAGVDFTELGFDHAPSGLGYGLAAAEALDLDPAQVFKTLMVSLDGALAVALVPVSSRLDLKAVAAALGGKRATMADPAVAERATGYVVGGISPLGQRRSHPTVVDLSVRDWQRVYVSGGRRGLDVGLSPTDLVTLTRARVATIGREP